MRTGLGVTLVCLFLVSVRPASAQMPPHYWSQRVGGSSDDYVTGVAVDGSGNVLVSGYFQGTANFGGANLVSAGGYDVFLARYAPNGTHQWSQRFGAANDDRAFDVAVDASGNVVITGWFAGTVDFGGGGLAAVGIDVFVAKYNASGTHQWSQRFGGAGASCSGNDVAMDGTGNVLVTGYFQNTVDFGGGGLVSAGGQDIFLAKYNASGAHQWSQRFGSTGSDRGEGVFGDGSGNVLVTGSFSGTVDFGGGGLVSVGSIDIVVAEYNSSGTHQWSKRFGSTGLDRGNAVAVDGSGKIVVTGSFSGTVDFGGGGLVSAGNEDVFLIQLTSSGAHAWSKRFGGTSNDGGRALSVNAAGNVALTGIVVGNVDFGGGALVGFGNFDVFVAAYSSGGVHQWSRDYGSASSDTGDGVVLDDLGNAVLTGGFFSTVDFGGGGLVSAGSQDVFLAKYAINPKPVMASITDVGNDQGRQVRISFDRSGYDDPSNATPIVRYSAYRRIDSSPDYEFVGEIPAFGEDSYSMIAPTLADSTITAGQHYSVFFIRASTDAPVSFYDSAVDSGYSLDNLVPGVPLNFIFTAGQLTWDKSSAPDFDHFTVYGSNRDSFGAATIVDYSTEPALDVTASPYAFYFVTATDRSGNESKPAVVNSLQGAGATPATRVLSISAYPNPFNPETTVRYTLPAKGRVTIDIFDARGAHVATMINEEKNTGAYTATWTGRDDNGVAVGSGVYFARLTSPAGTRSYKLTLLK